MTIRFLGQSGYLIKTENSEILIDPHLFADFMYGGFVMEFNREYNLESNNVLV